MAFTPGRRAAVVLLATIVGVVATVRLGLWQLDRAAQKIAIQTQIDARRTLAPLGGADLAHSSAAAEPQHYRRAVLRGRWLSDRTVFLDNRQMNGAPGFFVVTPLRLDGSADTVIVLRGWTPRDFLDRTVLPALPMPAGSVEVDGMIAPPPSRLYEFSHEASGPIRQNLDLEGYAGETGLALLPLAMLQSDSAATAGDGLRRQWVPPALDVSKHYGYAFQWFALATLMAGLYVWFQLIRPTRRKA